MICIDLDRVNQLSDPANLIVLIGLFIAAALAFSAWRLSASRPDGSLLSSLGSIAIFCATLVFLHAENSHRRDYNESVRRIEIMERE